MRVREIKDYFNSPTGFEIVDFSELREASEAEWQEPIEIYPSTRTVNLISIDATVDDFIDTVTQYLGPANVLD